MKALSAELTSTSLLDGRAGPRDALAVVGAIPVCDSSVPTMGRAAGTPALTFGPLLADYEGLGGIFIVALIVAIAATAVAARGAARLFGRPSTGADSAASPPSDGGADQATASAGEVVGKPARLQVYASLYLILGVGLTAVGCLLGVVILLFNPSPGFFVMFGVPLVLGILCLICSASLNGFGSRALRWALRLQVLFLLVAPLACWQRWRPGSQTQDGNSGLFVGWDFLWGGLTVLAALTLVALRAADAKLAFRPPESASSEEARH